MTSRTAVLSAIAIAIAAALTGPETYGALVLANNARIVRVKIDHRMRRVTVLALRDRGRGVPTLGPRGDVRSTNDAPPRRLVSRRIAAVRLERHAGLALGVRT